MAGRSAQTYEKLSFFTIFRRLGPFPLVFGQVKEWVLLELHKIRVLHLVPCRIDSFFMSEVGREERSKLSKMTIFLLLAVWVLSPKFLGR